MIILVEGVDKTGKTTLIKHLRKELMFDVLEHSAKRSAQEALGAAFETLRSLAPGKSYIFDRFYYPSDLVYGPVVGGYVIPATIEEIYIEEVEPWLQKLDTRLVYCGAPVSVIAQRLDEQPDDYINGTHVIDLLERYDQFLQHTKLPHIRLDSGKLTQEEMLAEAMKFIYKEVRKMKVAVIAPVPLLERYGAITDYHLVLTHLVLRDNYYTQFYQRRKRKGDYLILDNSLIELGEAMSISDVLRAAELVQPDEIVLPDKFKDGPATLELIKQTLKELPKDLPYKLMAVPQGKDLHEWLECYNEILNLERIQVVGIPKVTQTYTIGRAGLTTLLSQKNLIDHGRDYHLLGVWENPFEIALQARHYWIRGVDTSIAVLCGQLGIAFDFQRGLLISRPEIKLDFYNASDPFPHITENNILCMLRWAQCK